MAQATVQVQYDALERIAQQFALHAQNITQLARYLETAVDDLHRTGWEGDNSDAFHEEMHATVVPAVFVLAKALSEAESTTLRIVDVFRNAEEETTFGIEFGAGGGAGGGGGAVDAVNESEWLKNSKSIVMQLLQKTDAYKAFTNAIDGPLFRKFLDLTGKNADDFTTITDALKKIDSTSFTSGAVGGVVDHIADVLSGDKAWNDFENLGVQVTSGIGQTALIVGLGAGAALLSPVAVKAVAIAVTAEQIAQISLSGAELVTDIYGSLTGINTDGLETSIRGLRETISLDHWVDKGTQWTFDQAEGFLNDAKGYFGF